MDMPNNGGRNGQYYDSASSGEPDDDLVAAFQRYYQANIAAAANNGISNPSSTRTFAGLNSYAASAGGPDAVGSTASTTNADEDLTAFERYLVLSSMNNSQANTIAAATNIISNVSSTRTYAGLNSYAAVPRTVYSLPTTPAVVAPTAASTYYALLQSGFYSVPNLTNFSYEPGNSQGLNSAGGVQSRGPSTGASQLQNLSQSDTYSYSSLLPTYSYSTLPSTASMLPSTYSYSTLPNTYQYSNSTLPTYQYTTLPAYSYSSLSATTSSSGGNADLLMLLLAGQQGQVSRNQEEDLEQYLETLPSFAQDDCVPGLSSGVEMGKTGIEASHQCVVSPVKLENTKRKRKSTQGSETARPNKKVAK